VTATLAGAPSPGARAAGATCPPPKNKCTLVDKSSETVESWAQNQPPERANLARRYLALLRAPRERPPEPAAGGTWWGRSLVSRAVLLHGERLKNRAALRLVLQSPTGELVLVCPRYRGSPGYSDRQYRRLQSLLTYHRRPTALLTFTVKPGRFGSDGHAYRSLQSAWRRQREWLRRRYPSLQYVKAVEAQHQGQPHLHVLVYGLHVKRGTERQLGRELYGCGGCGWVDVSAVRRGRRGAVTYLAKYLYAGTGSDRCPTPAFLPRWGARTLELSGELREALGPLYPPPGAEPGAWRVVGLGDLRHLAQLAKPGGAVITLDSLAAAVRCDADGGTARLLDLVHELGAEPVAELLGDRERVGELELAALLAQADGLERYWSAPAVAARGERRAAAA